MKKEGLMFAGVIVVLAVLLGSLVYVYVGDGVDGYNNQDDNIDNDNINDGSDPNEGLVLARDFSLPKVGGGTMMLSNLRGKVVVLDFMATWCGPCATEIQHLKQVDEAYDSSVVVISIDVDESESDSLLTSYALEKGITWPILRDIQDVSSAPGYEVTGIPTLVVVNQDGYIAHRSVGITSADELAAAIDPLL